MKTPGGWFLRMRAGGKSNSPGVLTKANWPIISPRLWHWQERMKLLAMATLAYAFLLHLLAPRYEPLRLWLLRTDLASHWLALALGQGPTLPPACCPQSLVATLSTLLCCFGQAAPGARSWSSHLRLCALCCSRPAPAPTGNVIRGTEPSDGCTASPGSLGGAMSHEQPSRCSSAPLLSFPAPRLAPSLTGGCSFAPILMKGRGAPLR